jgi:hypothetical protein
VIRKLTEDKMVWLGVTGQGRRNGRRSRLGQQNTAGPHEEPPRFDKGEKARLRGGSER